MWIAGHTIVGYFLVRGLAGARRETPGGRLLISVLLFANLPDLLHFGPMRVLSHNIIGTLLLSLEFALMLYLLGVLDGSGMAYGVLAGLTHIPADIVFSDFFPFYPFDSTVYYYFGWNRMDDLVAESVLIMAFVVLFIKAGDARRLGSFFGERGISARLKEVLDPDNLAYFLFLGFLALCAAQYAVYLSWNKGTLLIGVWHVWLNLAMFTVFNVTMFTPLFRGKGTGQGGQGM